MHDHMFNVIGLQLTFGGFLLTRDKKEKKVKKKLGKEGGFQNKS